MPIITSQFHPPFLLRNPHLQTILSKIATDNKPAATTYERLELPDGDFLDIDLKTVGADRVVILSHGLEGSSKSGYIHALSTHLACKGWDIAAWNMRGCSGTPNRLISSYHSGKSEDLLAVLSWIQRVMSYKKIALVGVSIGGNISLKLLGELKDEAPIAAAVAISPPIDLASSAYTLASLSRRPYMEYLLTQLRRKMKEKKDLFPSAPSIEGIDTIRTFEEFDDRFTAPLNGFSSATDYWTRSSSRSLLHKVTVPTLILTARDDPFLGHECYPDDIAKKSSSVFLEATTHGGHVGFLSGLVTPWYPGRVSEFLEQSLDGSVLITS